MLISSAQSVEGRVSRRIRIVEGEGAGELATKTANPKFIKSFGLTL